MRTAPGITVEIAEKPPDDVEWDLLVDRSGAPLFYRSDVLRAYWRFPLRTTLAMHFIRVHDRTTGRLRAVLPTFLLPPDDPLGVCPAMLPGFRADEGPLLLSHMWHWYDTCLPADSLDAELLHAVRQGLRGLAERTGAQAYGFMNMPEGGALAGLLADSGAAVHPIDARYLLDVRGMRSADDYLAGLRPRPRQEMRRHIRLMEAGGYRLTVGPPEPDDMAAAARLCQVTSAKHGNPGWYDPERLTKFGTELRRYVNLVTIRRNSDIVAASISLVDGRRFHNWAAGTQRLGDLGFSPYQVMLHATVQAAIDNGCALLEGGRRNDAWKERLGLTRRVLLGCLVPAGQEK